MRGVGGGPQRHAMSLYSRECLFNQSSGFFSERTSSPENGPLRQRGMQTHARVRIVQGVIYTRVKSKSVVIYRR